MGLVAADRAVGHDGVGGGPVSTGWWPDREAEALFQREYPRLVATGYAILGDWETAKEIASDAFVAFLRHRVTVDGYENPGAWLRRVAIRDAVRAQRRGRRPWVSPPVGSEPDHDRRLDVRRALLTLPVRQRAAVVLHYLDDLPVSEIATVMRCSEGAVKTHLHRGRLALAALLKEDVDDAR